MRSKKGRFRLFIRGIGGGGGNRTRVRKPLTVRTTCLAWSFEFRLERADRQAHSRLATSTDPPGEGATPGREADVNDAALPGGLPRRESLAHQQTSAASSRY